MQQCMPAIRIAPHALDGCGQSIVELPAVDESGERIVARLVMQRPMHAPLVIHAVVMLADGAQQSVQIHLAVAAEGIRDLPMQQAVETLQRRRLAANRG